MHQICCIPSAAPPENELLYTDDLVSSLAPFFESSSQTLKKRNRYAETSGTIRDSNCGQSQNKKKKVEQNRVQFADMLKGTTKLVTTRQIKDSEQDIARRWIQRHEYKAIRQENIRTILELRKANGRYTEIDPTKYCLRGLENLASLYVFHTFQNQAKLGPQRVIEFQRIQLKMGHRDPDLLRQMATTFSRKDQIKAHKMALIDALL